MPWQIRVRNACGAAGNNSNYATRDLNLRIRGTRNGFRSVRRWQTRADYLASINAWSRSNSPSRQMSVTPHLPLNGQNIFGDRS